MSGRNQRTLVSFVQIFCFLGLSVALIGCGRIERPTSEGSARSDTFDIGMVTFPGYAPLYLAKEKGFFGDLQVELHRIEEVASIRAGVQRGDLEAYLATLDIALDTDAAPPGVAIWAIDESAGGDGVVVAGDIQNLKELRGRKLAAEPGLPPNFVLMYLLHQNGLSLKDIQFEDMSTQDASTAFISKSVDAAGLYEPYLTSAKNQRDGSKIVISSAQTPGLIVDLIFVRGDQLDANKQAVEKLIAGWRKAIQFIGESPDEAYEIMAKAFNVPVAEFRDIVSGIVWLDLEQNVRLFGADSAPGPLYGNVGVVHDVLQRNRSSVYDTQSKDILDRRFVRRLSESK